MFTGGCVVTPDSAVSLANASQLLGVGKDELQDSLISRVMQSKGGLKGTIIK